MKQVTYYDLTTGEILVTLTGSDFEISANAPPNSGYVDGTYDYNRYYVSGGKITEKKTMVVKISGNVITGLPNPTTVYVENKTYTVTDGEFDFQSDLPGPYNLRLSSPKYLTKEVTLS